MGSVRVLRSGPLLTLLVFFMALLLLPLNAGARPRKTDAKALPSAWLQIHDKTDYRDPDAMRKTLKAFKVAEGSDAAQGTLDDLQAAVALALVLWQWTPDDEERKDLAAKAFAWSYAAHQKAPDDPMVKYLRAKSQLFNVESQGFYRSLLSLGKIEEMALSVFISEPDFFHGNALALLGRLYLQAPGFPVSIGDNDKALQMLKQALQDSSRQTEAFISLARISLRDGDRDGAIAFLQKVQSVPAAKKSKTPAEKSMDAQWFLDQARAAHGLKVLADNESGKSISNSIVDSVRGVPARDITARLPAPGGKKAPKKK